MTSSITAMRWCAAGGVLAAALGLLGAAPAAAAEPDLTITLPVALVVGDPDLETIPGPATITGCPARSVLDIEMTRLDGSGGVVGHPIAIRDRVPSSGVYPLSLSRGETILYGAGTPSTGSIVIDAECADTGESATATAPVLPLVISLPPGVTVLGIAEHPATPDALLSGCPGAFRIETSYNYPLGDGGVEVSLPIALIPAAQAQPDGTFAFSFQTITDWLDTQQPNRNGSVRIAALCFLATESGGLWPAATAAVTIPAGVSLGGSEPPVPPAPPAPPVGQPGSAAPSAADPAALPLEPATSAHTLAATGGPTAAQSLVGVALLLMGAAATLISWRRRLANSR